MKLRFAFDVQCPYAYLASKRVRSLTPTPIEYFPVLLGGLYHDTQSPQGKSGSATDVMAASKVAFNAQDLRREAERWAVPLVFNEKHPVRSVRAQRLICGVENAEVRERIVGDLFELYWRENGDVSDVGELKRIAGKYGLDEEFVDRALGDKEGLRRNTVWASERGVFGVPAFFVMENGKVKGERFWFGGDRAFFVAKELGAGGPAAKPLRLYENLSKTRKPRLEFFHDFSSPWSYLGSTQIERIAKEHGAELVYRPILLGALFKQIGTPNVPMFAMSDAKRAYMAMDMEDWRKWWGDVKLVFPQKFPVKTVTPLRVSILEPKTIPHIYRAIWGGGPDAIDGGDDNLLAEFLTKNGFDGRGLVERAQKDAEIKSVLQKNTAEAVERGVCGVPSCSVDGGDVIWGQDRFNVVEDLLELGAAGQGGSGNSSGGGKSSGGGISSGSGSGSSSGSSSSGSKL